MTIYNQGTRIVTICGSIDGMITGVCIRNGMPGYEIRYVCCGDFKTEWLYPFEFELPNKRYAGFNNPMNEPENLSTNTLILKEEN